MKYHIFFMLLLIVASCNKKAQIQNPFTGDELYLPYDIDECGVGLPIVLEKERVKKSFIYEF